MLLLLMLLSLGVTIQSAPVEIHPITRKGVVFEPLRKVQIYRDHWTIVTRLSKPTWELHLKYLEECETAIHHLCDNTGILVGEDYCYHWQSEIRKQVKQIRELMDKADFTLTPHGRTKRGLINLGGKIIKSIFGTMDSEDSEHIHQKLAELEDNTKATLDLAKQQVTVMKATLKAMSKSNEEMTIRQNKLTQKVELFNSKIGEVDKHSDQIRVIQVRLDLNEVILFMMAELQQMYLEITDLFIVLQALNRRELSPLLLSTRQILEVYAKAIESQQGRKTFMDQITLQKIARVDYEQSPGGILIQVQLPLLEGQLYTLNRIYTTPIDSGHNSYYVYDIGTTYYLNTSRSQQNFGLTELDYQSQCTQVNTTYSVCHHGDPVLAKPTRTDCTSALFRATEQVPTNCQIRVLINAGPVIIPMHQDNAWLYWVQQPTPLISQCENQEQTYQLIGLGIVELKHKCMYHLAEYTLPYRITEIQPLNMHQPGEILPPTVDFARYRVPIKPRKTETRMEILHPVSVNDHFKGISDTLEELDTKITESQQNRHRKIQLHTTTGVTGGLLVVIIISVLIRNYGRCKNRSRRPPPQPSRPSPRRVQIVSMPVTIPRGEQILRQNGNSEQTPGPAPAGTTEQPSA